MIPALVVSAVVTGLGLYYLSGKKHPLEVLAEVVAPKRKTENAPKVSTWVGPEITREAEASSTSGLLPGIALGLGVYLLMRR